MPYFYRLKSFMVNPPKVKAVKWDGKNTDEVLKVYFDSEAYDSKPHIKDGVLYFPATFNKTLPLNYYLVKHGRKTEAMSEKDFNTLYERDETERDCDK